jgi:hypothetical protein
MVVVAALDRQEAQAVGVLCGRQRCDDIVDASVVLLARRMGARVVTSDPTDLTKLDPHLDVVTC